MPRQSTPDAASGLPRVWHWWKSAGGDCNEQEAVAVIRHGNPTPTEVQMRVTEFKSIVRQAQLGELEAGGWKPVRRHPELWELRWKWPGGAQVRAYFHEPDGQWGHSGVIARVHVKWISSKPDPSVRKHEIRVEQNREFWAAAQRIENEASHGWGLPGSPRVV